MFPATGGELPGSGSFRDHYAFRGALDRSNAFDLNSINSPRQPRDILRLDRKQQLEIFTTMQRKLKRIEGTTPT